MQAVLTAIQQAINEIMPQAVEKAKTLAANTAKHVACHDFAGDPNEGGFLKGATSMVSEYICCLFVILKYI